MDMFSEEEIRAYLNEQLSNSRASEIEKALRESPELEQKLREIAESTAGQNHSVGQIWRNGQFSCPTRSQLGAYLLGTLEPEVSQYVKFHLETIGCRLCNANLEDLKSASENGKETQARRQKYFQTSVGYLKKT